MCINHRPTPLLQQPTFFAHCVKNAEKKVCSKSDTASKNNKQSRFNSFVVSWFPWLSIPWLATSPSDHVPQNWYWEKSNFMNVWSAVLQTHNDCPQNFFHQKLLHPKSFRNAQTNFLKSFSYPRNIPGKETVSDYTSIGRKEPSFNILFVIKIIVDPCEIYMVASVNDH